jgi:hypothetical protein
MLATITTALSAARPVRIATSSAAEFRRDHNLAGVPLGSVVRPRPGAASSRPRSSTLGPAAAVLNIIGRTELMA